MRSQAAEKGSTGADFTIEIEQVWLQCRPGWLATKEMPMSISMYDFSIQVLTRGLTNLSAVLDKGAAHAAAKKFDPVALAQARLFPDMYPLVRQVQIACDTAKGAAARLAGIEVPKHEDTEVTFADLKARIAKTQDFVRSVNATQLMAPSPPTLPRCPMTPGIVNPADLDGFVSFRDFTAISNSPQATSTNTRYEPMVAAATPPTTT